MKTRLKKIAIGFMLSTLPLVACLAIAALLVLTGSPTDDPHIIQQRRHGASTVRYLGFILTGVAYCGMGLYTLSSLYEYAVVSRHARKIDRLKEQGKI